MNRRFIVANQIIERAMSYRMARGELSTDERVYLDVSLGAEPDKAMIDAVADEVRAIVREGAAR